MSYFARLQGWSLTPHIRQLGRFGGVAIIIGATFAASAQQTENKISAGSSQVLAQDGFNVKITTRDGFAVGQNLLVVRMKEDEDDFEVIGNGKITKVGDSATFMKLNEDTFKKVPRNGDRVVSLGAPKIFRPPVTKKPTPEDIPTIAEPEAPEPGYLHLMMTRTQGSLKSQSPNIANSLKTLNSMKLGGFMVDWYLDYLSSYGLTFYAATAAVPIESYYRKDVNAQVSDFFVRLKYRTHKIGGFRWEFFFQGETESFTTDNPDEYIIGGKTDSNYLGVITTWEHGDLLQKTHKWSFRFTRVSLLLTQSLTAQITDAKISRGTSSAGSNINDLQLGTEFTAYIPYLKYAPRWTIGLAYYMRLRNIKMSGATNSENADFYKIPEGQAYKETENGFLLTLGIRYEDFIGKIFKPRD